MARFVGVGMRKVFLGMFFLSGMFGAVYLSMVMVPGENLASVLTSLGVCGTAMSVGLGAVIYGNVKEHEAKSNGGS